MARTPDLFDREVIKNGAKTQDDKAFSSLFENALFKLERDLTGNRFAKSLSLPPYSFSSVEITPKNETALSVMSLYPRLGLHNILTLLNYSFILTF